MARRRLVKTMARQHQVEECLQAKSRSAAFWQQHAKVAKEEAGAL